ncbi:hypothetical protein Nepgr_013559 [Nepenthes gracilis]|uniref:Uncharacterized protein n=1 Tax=Nepenthes gracilis TaxID=150966 RepID=A0AAD3SI32_NEPGR|nr:hypothetical protein Nepgr_013559 [Nepenthes gracilis]
MLEVAELICYSEVPCPLLRPAKSGAAGHCKELKASAPFNSPSSKSTSQQGTSPRIKQEEKKTPKAIQRKIFQEDYTSSTTLSFSSKVEQNPIQLLKVEPQSHPIMNAGLRPHSSAPEH